MKPPPFEFNNIRDWLDAKAAGYFVVEPWGTGWAIIIHRAGRPMETRLVETPAEANRVRQSLSDEGLCGYVAEGA
ncbi:hypothetical protein [Hansschlegelia zhihuaiae]|jgi:hypothetical protein|uniref:Uncharacterized protein n=1 Tax=Hansschlegelia zhihuaiae TaxID=405005 RepID=A0A4Q0MLG3_9HYPH|nr:hypothetical protein [Hansschlegelia zhihuaiae]RXF73899.1 hypothetical protein EK403_07955 [Hansschlegelia zhihuaiae]